MVESLIMGGLSGAFSLIGGLGARQAAKSQQKRQLAYDMAAAESNRGLSKEMLSDIPVRIAKDAEVSGFNPVTWLQAGALGHYANAYGLRAATTSQAVNIPSIGQAVGDAGAAALSAFSTQRRFDQSQALQSSMLDRQIGAISAARSGSKGRGVALPGATVGQSASTSILGGTGGPLFGGRAAPGATVGGGVTAGTLSSWQLPPFVTKDKLDPWGSPRNRKLPDAQDAEDFGGEGAGFLQGAWNVMDKLWRESPTVRARNWRNDDLLTTVKRGWDYKVFDVPKFETPEWMLRPPIDLNSLFTTGGARASTGGGF